MDHTLEIILGILMVILVVVGAIRTHTPGSTDWGTRANTRWQEYIYNTFFAGSILGLLATLYGLGVPNMTICLGGLIAFLGLLFIANNLLPFPDWALPPSKQRRRVEGDAGSVLPSKRTLVCLVLAFIAALVAAFLHPNLMRMVNGSLIGSALVFVLGCPTFLMLGFLEGIFSSTTWKTLLKDVSVFGLSGGVSGAAIGGFCAAIGGSLESSPIAFVAGLAVGAPIALVICGVLSLLWGAIMLLVANTIKGICGINGGNKD